MQSELSEPAETRSAITEDVDRVISTADTPAQPGTEPLAADRSAGAEHANPPAAVEGFATTGDQMSTYPPVEAPTRSSRRRAIIAWSAGIAALLIVLAVIAWVHVSASTSFYPPVARLVSAAKAAAAAEDSLQDVDTAVAASLVSADQIVSDADDALVDANTRSAFSTAIATASEASQDVASLLKRDVDSGEFDKPFWTWDLWNETAALEVRAATADDLAADMATADAAMAADDHAMVEAALALYSSVAERASALEVANISAHATTVLDFRDAAAEVADLTRLNSGAAVAFSVLATRADLLAASSNAELAEKAGPLYGTRLEVEAYARSISGGIVLDFDWAPVVNEMGGYWGIGGLADWTADRGGFSTITLSNSVAEWWTADAARVADARALVTHEVGHAIAGKCFEKFDWNSREANEEWATAWAISMGHTAEGNGVQAYGYPSQTMIDAAATCR